MAHYLEKVLNKAKSKSPHEMVAKCYAALEKLGEGSSDKQQEELGTYLGLLKVRNVSTRFTTKGQPSEEFKGPSKPRCCSCKSDHCWQCSCGIGCRYFFCWSLLLFECICASNSTHSIILQVVIYGDGEVEPSKDSAVLLALEACKLDLPMLLCQKLALLDFESRKDAAQVRIGACCALMLCTCRHPARLCYIIEASHAADF